MELLQCQAAAQDTRHASSRRVRLCPLPAMTSMSLKRNVLTIFQGSVVAQAIGVLVLPILSRLYDAEALGLYQVYTTIVAFILVSSFWRYEIAILNAESDEELFHLVRLSVGINLLMAGVLSLACLGVGVYAPTWPPPGFSLWILPLAFVL
ncbi:MAG TPA: hypothetical protein VIY86_06380, partial [Pirellulaceae bacterium]